MKYGEYFKLRIADAIDDDKRGCGNDKFPAACDPPLASQQRVFRKLAALSRIRRTIRPAARRFSRAI
jgi:hypothetical protein